MSFHGYVPRKSLSSCESINLEALTGGEPDTRSGRATILVLIAAGTTGIVAQRHREYPIDGETTRMGPGKTDAAGIKGIGVTAATCSIPSSPGSLMLACDTRIKEGITIQVRNTQHG